MTIEAGDDMGKEEHVFIAVGVYELLQLLKKSVQGFLKKLKITSLQTNFFWQRLLTS